MFEEDFGGFFSYEALEFFAPFNQQNAVCIHEIIERQSIKLPMGIDAVQIDMVENYAGAAVFVDESKSGAGHIVGIGGLEGFGDAFDQRGLACPEFSAQQDDGSRLQRPSKLTAQLGGLFRRMGRKGLHLWM